MQIQTIECSYDAFNFRLYEMQLPADEEEKIKRLLNYIFSKQDDEDDGVPVGNNRFAVLAEPEKDAEMHVVFEKNRLCKVWGAGSAKTVQVIGEYEGEMKEKMQQAIILDVYKEVSKYKSFCLLVLVILMI